MDKSNHSPKKRIRRLVAVLLTLMVLSPGTAVANELFNGSWYTMSSSVDHLTFNLLLADLRGRDDWVETGRVKAYSQYGRKGTSYSLFNVWTVDQANTSEHRIYGKIEQDGALGKITHLKKGIDHLTNGSDASWIEIEDSKKNFPQVHIDFYWAPVLGGKTWYFYFEGESDEGDDLTYYLGAATCSTYLGRPSMDVRSYTCTRKNSQQIEFSIPGTPTGSAAAGYQWHEGSYEVTFNYQLYSGKTVTQSETFKCESGKRKANIVNIPAEAAAFRSLDMTVKATDSYVNKNGKSYYDRVATYNNSNVLPTVPTPNNIVAEYRQFDAKIALNWTSYVSTGAVAYSYIGASVPYVYRVETDADGNPLSGQNWKKLGTLKEVGSNKSYTYSDNSGIKANTYYKYLVANVPKDWINANDIATGELNNPADAFSGILSRVGYVETAVISTEPSVDIFDLVQDQDVTDKVVLQWKYSRVPGVSGNVTFDIWRSPMGTSDWNKIGSTTNKANPDANTVATFTDTDLSNEKVRYDYKVQLSINSGRNVFESDALTAGLLKGTSLSDFTATKGTHDNSVLLEWTAHHVGTDNTNYDIYRRYVGDESNDWMKAYSVSGRSDSYTYEDKTVRPGYYYEYKLEAYTGEKVSDSTPVSTLTSIGFCQARGVVSGRVSFSTGNTAVEDVRVTLRSGDQGDNAVRGYSQRIDGATTGITWEADSTELAKVFASDKNFTVQMFVRPDSALTEGAVIGEIPGVGQLVVGPLTADGYQLYCEKDMKYHVTSEMYIGNVNHFRAYYTDVSASGNRTYDGDVVYSKAQGEAIRAQWEREGFSYLTAFAAEWVGTSSSRIYLFRKTGDIVAKNKGNVRASFYDLGITIPVGAYAALTVRKSNAGLTVSVGDSISTTMTFAKERDIMPFEEAFAYEDDVVTYNGMPVYFGGTLMTSLAATGWAWQGRTNNLTPTSTSPVERAVDYNLPFDHNSYFSVGGSQDITDEQAFLGNVTEVRVWDHALTEKEQAIYADRVLSGREAGLKLYWPMDEGQDRLVFDASYSNDVPNGRHATVGTNVSSSVIIPDEEQLSRYGLTNESGEYTIRGIPFVGSGTTYTITPTKGIHTFTPAQRNGFIGPSSLALNGTDFNDDSSFPMRGHVTYLNTNIPVDSVQFKIDGTAAQNKQGLLMSDANGEYEISVPIGNHRIEAWKDGHLLTSFPLKEGQTHDFTKSEVVNFVDSTLVNVTGRINGGFTDKDEPLGFGRSKNRIGQATVKLSLGKESQCSFNYITDDHGDGDFGTTDIPVASATELIKSTAYRAGMKPDKDGKTDNTGTHYIYIKTDPATGEFSALLPPLRYKVESITFDNDTKDGTARYNNLEFFTQNLPVISATVTNEKEMKCDSLTTEGGNTQFYYYSGKMVRQLRNEPTLTVEQIGMMNGAFGLDSLEVADVDGTTEMVPITEFTADSYSYNYGYPMFQQNETYNMTISLAEEYVNVDTKETFTEIPADATIHIANEGSISTAVIAEKCTLNGKDMEVGEVYAVSSIEATPDEKGQVHYSWIAGLPNLAGEHLRTLSVSAKVDGRTTMWKPDGQATGLDFVALGGIITGTNFVTGGPDHVDMILRRPPGSTAYTTWTVDTIHSNYVTTSSFDSHSGGGGLYVNVIPTFKAAAGTAFFWGISEIAGKGEHTVTRANISEDADVLKVANSYTISESKTTPTGNTYTQRNGDTFIGRATNLLFGKGEAINLFKQSDGTYKIDQQETICTGEQFSTTFVYPHQYIEDVLLPNWEKLIDGYLTHWDGDLSTAPKVAGKMMYYTKYNKGDTAWGKANSDTDFWTSEQIRQAGGMPGYRVVNGLEGEERKNACDSVEWCANQIKTWKYWLAQNEEDKVDAFTSEGYFDKNYSIAGGTSVSQTAKSTRENTKGHTVKSSVSVNNETHIGALFNGAGAYAILKFNDSWGNTKDTSSTDATVETFSWRLSDNEPTTALSVDVYKSPNGWSPIFRTRGGQTSNPYEGATYTKYFNPGTQLDEATMRVEKPELRVDGPTEITDVPTGGTAKFNLQLYNASETNTICTYMLETKENSNPNGAILTIDGMPQSSGKIGRTVKMKGGELITKQLLVSQSDRSIIDYDDIELVLKSVNDTSTVSDPVKLRVHFVPSSSPVELAVDHTVVNKAFIDDNGGITARMTGLNRQDQGLQGLRLRYRRKGTDSWTLIKQWTTIAKLVGDDYEPMPDGSQVMEKVTFLADGTYELQAQTFGMYGSQEVTYQSNIVELVQDTHGPKMLGMVNPTDGNLTMKNLNNMHLRFNETLNGNALSKSDNFRIEGGMNNVVYGESPYPDVAVQLNGDRIETEAMYDLTNTDYAFDFWFYRQGDGTIISLGTDDNLLALSTHDNGMLQARIGDDDEVYDTGTMLPRDKWMYVALNYKRRAAGGDVQSVGGDLQSTAKNTITMLYVTADDNEPVYVGQDVPARDLSGRGKLGIGGDGMTGMISALSVWNSDITAQQLYETRNQQRASFTPGLVGYWRMDEGHGTQITDLARSRNMLMPAESWYINNQNRAAHLNGEPGSPIKIDIATFNPAKTDNFAYEMWFRGTEDDNGDGATLMSVQNSSTLTREVTDSTTITTEAGNDYQQYIYRTTTSEIRTDIGFDAGVLKLKVIEDLEIHDTEGVYVIIDEKSDVTLSDRNYLDGNWHHMALNVRRGTSAIVYIDGEAVKVLPESAVPGVSAHYLVVGGDAVHIKNERNCFKGDVDEIRIWSAALDGQLISDRRYERMDNSYPGLVGYFPMESIHRNEQGTVITEFCMDNFGESTSRLKIDSTLFVTLISDSPQLPAESRNAPALKPGSTKMRLDDSQFDFTASADEIYFSFPESSLPLMDGNDFTATVSYIKDEHGNNSEPVQWKFQANFASVEWADKVSNVSKKWDEPLNWIQKVTNNTGKPQSYEISGLPTWMTAAVPRGTIDGDFDLLEFNIGINAPIGNHIIYAYLTDRLGIRRVLQLNVTVEGDAPDWTVNTNRYESNMTLTGQVYVGDKICEYSETMVAAFDDMGNCCGMAKPRYVTTRDAYFIDMIVYGAAPTDLSTGQRNLTFKMYDASAGIIYPVVELTMPDGTKSNTMTYVPDAIIGSYDTPVEFRSTDNVLQTVSLPRGWTWMSMYVQPESTAIGDILPKDPSQLMSYQNIKSKTAFASVASNGSAVKGSLAGMEPGQMYKIQVSADTSLDIYGKAIDVTQQEQTIRKGYNWIGTVSGSVMSPDEAFADLQPEVGDMVKSRRAYAMFGSRGTWEGILESIVPGEGYVYLSKADHDKTFHYPRSTTGTASSRRNIALTSHSSPLTSHYAPVDDSQFPDNMAIIAVVVRDGQPVEDAEVGAFINGECRGAVAFHNGYYFLTVMGSSADDRDATIELRVWHDGQEYIIENEKRFVSDAAYGTLDEPYVLDLDDTVGISVVDGFAIDDDSDWYTLQGFKLGRKPTSPGVYIHRGERVVLFHGSIR